MVYNCSTPKIISYIHLGLGWIDYFEINEAFSKKKTMFLPCDCTQKCHQTYFCCTHTYLQCYIFMNYFDYDSYKYIRVYIKKICHLNLCKDFLSSKYFSMNLLTQLFIFFCI